MAGALVCMQLDANSKLGKTIIPGDPAVEQSKNGELLMKVIEENDLIVVNATDVCKGVITRYRKTVNGEEKSSIDFFIVCRGFMQLVMEMEVTKGENMPWQHLQPKMRIKQLKQVIKI